MRFRHSKAVLGEMFHQLQVNRQLVGGQAFKQRQNVIASHPVILASDKVIGVFNAAGAGLHVTEFAQIYHARNRERASFLETSV